MQDLKVWEEIDDHTLYLRRRWVQGSAEWLAGKYESKENDKQVLGYSDYEWEFVWTTMVQDGAWAVPHIRDSAGRIVKENNGPEMMIKYIAHDIQCHIIIFDLFLNRIQFCSANQLKDGNVKFDSPLLLYATGGHFQAVHQKNHEFFISFARDLESGQASENQLICSFQSCLYPNLEHSKTNTAPSSKISSANTSSKVNQDMAKKEKVENTFNCLVSNSEKIGRKGLRSPPMKKKKTLEVSNRFECISPDETQAQSRLNIANDKRVFEEISKIKASNRTPEEKKIHSKLRMRLFRANQSIDLRQSEKIEDQERKTKLRYQQNEKECSTDKNGGSEKEEK